MGLKDGAPSAAGDTLPRSLTRELLRRAASRRCGILLEAYDVPVESCDVPGIFNAAVPAEAHNPWQAVSGAVAFDDPEHARDGAVAEGLERYSASIVPLQTLPRGDVPAGQRLDEDVFALFTKAQRDTPGFPWPMLIADDDPFVEVYRLRDNAPFWAPLELVALGTRAGRPRLPSTSSGLAAHGDGASGPWLSLLRAAQEMLERDALAVTWLNGLGGREIPLSSPYREQAEALGACIHAFDLTQAWNPHPVIAVAGRLDAEGRPRHAFGIACRASADDAMAKAWLEWAQSLRYADYIRRTQADDLPREPSGLRRFEEHAAFYTVRPELWGRTALMRGRHPAKARPPATDAPPSPAGQVEALCRALGDAGVELYYRELTSPDVAEAGLRVMRVLAPALSALHADERAPFLGGRCADVQWRYPGEARLSDLPNPLPHPLG